ncbi:hypothetical protein PPL_08473 [Heterostelium album PN500]|uniref:START domain-containing protein n=1 Tax=Heterostelium pallidum (strain ATCC 26659 / Pp 5 / PN500) TaxID=670386 RepID=D3BIA5_HETP5|nr:hypothetical protein PPL_08473 [Heterostelium album PN500]EFA79005.1 hypothetical protein PPL_08473 [Heterostelium album PN500]|eukprot:XP_020431129.1 hypothetical protein PPL_08473 [Heterostelium album PN500]
MDNSFNDTIIELIDCILDLCEKERIPQATKKLRELDQLIHNTLESYRANNQQNLLESLESFLKEKYHCYSRIKRLRSESKEIDDLLDILSPDYKNAGWNEISNKDGIFTLYKDNGGGMHSIRMEGIVESPIFDLCSVILEIDLYPTWIPRLLESTQLAEDKRYRKAIYCKVSCPWPVENRDVCLYGYGVDMLDECDKVVVVSRSFRDEDFEGVALPDVPKKVIRVDTRISGFVLKPISPTQTFVQVISLTDPKMSYIPYWLLNFVTTQFAHYLFVMLRKQANTVLSSEEYQRRINKNPLYLELKEKSDKYFNRINNNNNNNSNTDKQQQQQ